MDDVWSKSRNELVYTVTGLGFPAELGEAMAKQLGSPKAIDRMTAYLNYEKPTNVNMVVDEMLAICSEIDAWREKKTSIESNIKYNELLYFGLDDSD